MIFPRWLPDGPALFPVPATAFHPCCNSLVHSSGHLHLQPSPSTALARSSLSPNDQKLWLEQSRVRSGGDLWGTQGGRRSPLGASLCRRICKSRRPGLAAVSQLWSGSIKSGFPLPQCQLKVPGMRGAQPEGQDPAAGSAGVSPYPCLCQSYE